MAFELVLEHALLVDGTGAAARHADIGVERDRITAVGTVPESAETKRRVDLAGRVLAPGFIDLHTHSDVTLLEPGSGINVISQGVTTEVTGNCGFSAFPAVPERVALLEEHLAYLGPDRAAIAWSDFAGYAAALEQSEPVCNVACLAGHSALRIAVAGMSQDPLGADALQAMRTELERVLEQGAFGFSSGLTYVPSMYAPTAELAALGEVAARHDAIYATHARATAGRDLAAIEEAAEIGRLSGVRVEFSHLALNDPGRWGRAQESLAVFERARADGIDLAFDVYPYDASASSIAQYLPEWLIGGGEALARETLADPRSREQARRDLGAGFYGGIPWLWDRVLLTQLGESGSNHLGDLAGQVVGRRFDAIAELLDCDPTEAVLRVYEAAGNAAQVALFYRTEADMVEFLAHPLSAIGSDGLAVAPHSIRDRPHPRFYGTFPRVLGRYCRDHPVLSLEQAVRKMTGEPADRLGLSDRGYVAVGNAADLVLFNAGEVADTASFEASNQLPVGIEMVVVNGAVVFEGGRLTGRRAGRVLRHGTT